MEKNVCRERTVNNYQNLITQCFIMDPNQELGDPRKRLKWTEDNGTDILPNPWTEEIEEKRRKLI